MAEEEEADFKTSNYIVDQTLQENKDYFRYFIPPPHKKQNLHATVYIWLKIKQTKSQEVRNVNPIKVSIDKNN